SDALRLWWDLVSAWDGEPETMPHRFLQLTSENHRALTPSNARVWNEAELAFCDQHGLRADPVDEAPARRSPCPGPVGARAGRPPVGGTRGRSAAHPAGGPAAGRLS